MRLLVCGVNFGWGSAGKLAAILEVVRARRTDVHVTGFGTRLGRTILPGGLVDVWYDHEVSGRASARRALTYASPDAAIVILEPLVADALAAVRCPVVYVDSLPYLWTEHDPVPRHVAYYCAQRSLPISVTAQRVLEKVSRLTWVDPIVSASLFCPPPGPEIDPSSMLVSVGGMHSPTATTSEAAAYVASVLPAVMEAGAEHGVRRVIVAGNLTAVGLPPVQGVTLEVLSGTQPAFFNALRKAGRIAISPGLTTILEIATLGRSAVLLPPQNLSQFHHSHFVSSVVSSGVVIQWPQSVLSDADVRRWHDRGEAYALRHIYGAIESMARRPEVHHLELTAAVARALRGLDSHPEVFRRLTPRANGAEQVAECLFAAAADGVHSLG